MYTIHIPMTQASARTSHRWGPWSNRASQAVLNSTKVEVLSSSQREAVVRNYEKQQHIEALIPEAHAKLHNTFCQVGVGCVANLIDLRYVIQMSINGDEVCDIVLCLCFALMRNIMDVSSCAMRFACIFVYSYQLIGIRADSAEWTFQLAGG